MSRETCLVKGNETEEWEVDWIVNFLDSRLLTEIKHTVVEVEGCGEFTPNRQGEVDVFDGFKVNKV